LFRHSARVDLSLALAALLFANGGRDIVNGAGIPSYDLRCDWD
jgi:hypothetical protein